MFSVEHKVDELPTSDDEWAVSVEKTTSVDSSDDESFISIICIDKREEVFKKNDLKKLKEF